VHRRTIGLGLALLTVVAGTGALAAGATKSQDEGAIVACQKRGGGFLRVVRDASQCRQGERVIAWNKQGPPGRRARPGRQERTASPSPPVRKVLVVRLRVLTR
jgi:hypothetical protein